MTTTAPHCGTMVSVDTTGVARDSATSESDGAVIILVGVDGSHESAVATAWAADLARRVGGTVVAVHAAGLLEHVRGDPAGEHLEARLGDWTRVLDRLPEGAVRRRVVNGEPVSTLRRAVAEEGADILVVGTRGAGTSRPGLLGSTSLQLVHDCPCPVVVVPTSTSSTAGRSDA
jgi:nucleotide-binding universal stress UspA family protein